MARSSASRTNLVLVCAAAALAAGSGVVAAVGSRDSTDTSPVQSIPTQTGANNDVPLLRAPSVKDSWFDQSTDTESFDFPMPALSCPAMRPYLTLELCAVGNTPDGSFMVTAAEGFWDDQESFPEIPLDFTVYVHTSKNGPSRAMSVVTGNLTVPYDNGYVDDISIHTLQAGGRDVVAVLYTSRGADSRETVNTLQLLSMTDTGSPEVFAVVDGLNMSFGVDSNGVVVSTSRNGATAEKWATVYTFSRASDGSWTEGVTSRRRTGDLLTGKLQPVAIDKYVFPSNTSTSSSTSRA